MSKSRKIYTANADYQVIESIKNNRVKRNKHGLFFIEGVRNINAALKNKWEIESFIYDGERTLSGWAQGVLEATDTEVNYKLTSKLMAELSSKTDTSELMALARIRTTRTDDLKLGEESLILLFDRPSNKGNLGTIIRSCDSFGVSCLIITGHAIDPYDPEVIAASQGSFFCIPIIKMPRWDELRKFINQMEEKFSEFKTVGTSAHGDKVITRAIITAPAMIMIGNETEGLCEGLKLLSGQLIKIPMARESSASSLNVACAASIMLFEARRPLLSKFKQWPKKEE